MFTCEDIARKAGFAVSVGNWIAPDGSLILGESCDTHHLDTLEIYLKCGPKKCFQEYKKRNCLHCMTERVSEGFIRLVFREEVLFQVACTMGNLWSNEPNLNRLMDILKRLEDVVIHIFSRTFYIIGKSQDIVSQSLDKLEIRKK